MSTENQPIRCNLCNSARYYLVYKKPKRSNSEAKSVPRRYAISEAHLEKPDQIVRCMTCRLVYAIPEETTDNIVQDYLDMEDHEYLNEEKGRREQARFILSKVSHFKKQGRLLDVGCGPGLFLDEAKKRNWEISGVDLSSWASRYAKEHFGANVFTGSLFTAKFPDKTFDVITLMDVIEHVEDPKAFLTEVRRILKNDGILYLSTPDINSFFSFALKARWWGVNKYHLFYFSRSTLEKFFQEVGLKQVQYSSYPRIFSLNYWSDRLKAYPKIIHTTFDFFAKGWGRKDSLLKVVLYDQIGVIVKKLQRLDSVSDEIEKEKRPRIKQKIIAVLPAYNAEKTLEKTVADIPKDTVDEIILVDDASRDRTVPIAEKLGLVVYRHEKNRGYGGNQKTCYEKALQRGAEIVVMVHPDYQYDPRIIPQLIEPIERGEADAVFGSRMMKGGALEGGMPLWKHNANVLLTAFENVMLGTYLTEYHSGFRAYSAKVLKSINYRANSDGFIFDTEIIVQILVGHFKIDEIPIRTRYFEEASSIRLWPSIIYGVGIIRVMLEYFFYSRGLWKSGKF